MSYYLNPNVRLLNAQKNQLRQLLVSKGHERFFERSYTASEFGKIPKEVWQIAAWYAAANYRVALLMEYSEKNVCRGLSLEVNFRKERKYWEENFQVAFANC